MKKWVIILAVVAIVLAGIVLVLINSQHWNLHSCEEECIHRGYDKGDCLWDSEVSESDVSIGSCLVPQSKHCGNKGQCDCYCSNEQIIGGDTDEHGCYLMAGYNWCEAKKKCVRYWEEGCGDCEVDLDCVVFGESGECNCGCYNKEMMPTNSGGECFCAAPTSCECVNQSCEGIFE